MSVYLHDIPLPEALARLSEALKAAGRDGLLGIEEIPLDEHALGRVLAEPVWAKISSPHYHASAMDGFALRAEDTAGAMPSAPVTLALGDQAAYVDTGDPLPAWANAVVPIENVEPVDDAGQVATDAAPPRRHPSAGGPASLAARPSFRRGYRCYPARAACRAFAAPRGPGRHRCLRA